MSSESLTGDLQDGDLCDADIEVNLKRSEATVRFTIRNVSKKAEEDTAAYSPKFYVKNMPWRIRIRMKLGTRFEVCLCCRLPEDDESWSCKYGKEAFCRILPTSSDVICQDIFRPNYQTVLNTRVNSKTRDHSFSQNAIINNFVLDPKNCCIKDDAITLEMFICVTDPVNIPHTVSEEDDNCQEEVNDLIQAITLGDVEKCIALLQDSAYHSVEDNNGRTPLMWAAYKGNLKIVQLLVEANCKIDITDNFGYAPLMRAIEFGHMEVVKFLLEKDANINLATRDCLGCDNCYKFTALHFAEHHLNSEDMVKFLINNGADLSSIKKGTAANLVRNGARSQVDSSTVIWSIKWVIRGYHGELELTKMLLQTEEHINDRP